MPVAVATLGQIQDALATQIESGLAGAIPGLQVTGRLNFNPTPPAIDVYPADPFLAQVAFAVESQEATFVVRARVSTANQEGGQELLLELLDPRGDMSLVAVVAADPTLGGTVDDSAIEGASGFIVYEATGGGGSLLGCEWRTRVEL